MENELKSFVSFVKEKTGDRFEAFFEDAEEIKTKLKGADFVGDVFSDTLGGSTYFRFKLKDKKYIGSIDGAGKSERTVALLISEVAEKYYGKDADLSKKEVIKGLVLGDIASSDAKKYSAKFSFPDKKCFVLIIDTLTGDAGDIFSLLSNYGNGTDEVIKTDENRFIYVRFCEDENDEYRSAAEFAEFLRSSLYEECGAEANIFVGGAVKSVCEAHGSYFQALSTEYVKDKLGLKSGVHTYKEYVIVNILEDADKGKLREYLNVLTDGETSDIFDDEEMTATAETFLENSLNISETSRKLYLHRNTLMYRLDKIEKETGLNIRKFSDAMTFRIITVLFKLLK